MQSDLQRGAADAERNGSFARRVADEVDKQGCSPLGFGQHANGRRDIRHKCLLVWRFMTLPNESRFIKRLRSRRATRLSSVHPAVVENDAAEPAGKALRRIEAAQVQVCGERGLLQDVCDVLALRDEAARHTPARSPMPCHEYGEGIVIAGLCPCDECGIKLASADRRLERHRSPVMIVAELGQKVTLETRSLPLRRGVSESAG